jgi:hypothetical protein
LDLAVDTERRTALEQIPMRQVAAVAIEISTCCDYRSSNSLVPNPPGLMATTDLGAFKYLAIERFRGILQRMVKASIGNNSPLPSWAQAQVIEGWNVPILP